MNRHVTKEDIEMGNNHMKRCWAPYVIRKLQIKTTLRFHYTPLRMAKIQNTNNTKSWWEWKMVWPLWKTVWQLPTKLNMYLPLWSSHHTPWYLPKGTKNLCPHKDLHTDVYSSFIHYCQNLEANKRSFHRWTDKQTVVHPDNEILFNNKKK